MDLDRYTTKLYEIFCPDLIEQFSEITTENKRFVYYTSANTAFEILKKQQLWLRNATVMNDFSEISYGLHLIREVFSGDEGKKFRDAIDNVFPGTIEQADKQLADWESDWEFETYIASVSLHSSKEDKGGRLSMWRAYGDTALVINNTPMTSITDKLAVFSFPVLYLDQKDLQEYIAKINQQISENTEFLRELDQETILSYIHKMLFRIAVATKHPGFQEEQEWRLFYRPNEETNSIIKKEIVVLNGTPQKIYKLPLIHDPDNGLFNADVSTLLNKIIVGPTDFPYVSYCAFVDLLEELEVKNARDKVSTSDIPLRTK